MAKIAAVICTYNRYDLLPKAIDSLIKQSLSKEDYEIIVVDNTPNAKNDGGHRLQRQYSSVGNLHYFFENTPGLSNARNVAMHYTNANYISYIDDDAIATPVWLENIVKAFEMFDHAGIVGGRISPLWEAERPGWLGDDLLGHVSVVDWGGESRLALENEWFAGANISFRRENLLESGGFSTSLGRVGGGNSLMSNEEIQVVNYIKNAGYKSVYAPEAVVDHLVERKRLRRDWFRRRVAWQATSDFVMTPLTLESKLAEYQINVRSYISSLPPLMRNIQGLYMKTDSPSQFVWQLSAIYGFTVMVLAGFEGLESE